MTDFVPKGKRRLTAYLAAVGSAAVIELVANIAQLVNNSDAQGLSPAGSTALVGISVAYFASKFGEKPGTE